MPDGTIRLAASQANVGDKPRRYEKIVGQELRNKEWVDGKEPGEFQTVWGQIFHCYISR